MAKKEKLVGSEKAGNYLEIETVSIFVLQEAKRIVHKYKINQYDADGDFVQTLAEESCELSEEDFDLWIKPEMDAATMATIKADWEAKQNPEVEE